MRILHSIPELKFDLADATAAETAFKLALKYNLSADDASCLELAKRFRLPLHTTDHALAPAARAEDLPLP